MLFLDWQVKICIYLCFSHFTGWRGRCKKVLPSLRYMLLLWCFTSRAGTVTMRMLCLWCGFLPCLLFVECLNRLFGVLHVVNSWWKFFRRQCVVFQLGDWNNVLSFHCVVGRQNAGKCWNKAAVFYFILLTGHVLFSAIQWLDSNHVCNITKTYML